MSLKIQTPSKLEDINKQLRALGWQIKRDTNDKDRSIHEQALQVLRERKAQLQDDGLNE